MVGTPSKNGGHKAHVFVMFTGPIPKLSSDPLVEKTKPWHTVLGEEPGKQKGHEQLDST